MNQGIQSLSEQPADIAELRRQLSAMHQSVAAMEELLDRYVLSEQALRQSEEQFRLLVTNVRDYAIFMLDTQGHIASWNTGAQLIKGYTAAEIIGRHFSVFYPPADQAKGKPARALEIAVREGVYHDEGWRVRKDGSPFWASVVITALYDERGTLRGFGKVTRDLTERKLAEDAQQQLREQELHITREQAAREQAEANVRLRDEFLSMTAHELRTPVTAVLGYTQLMQRRLARGEATTERVAASIQAVLLQAQRLDRLTTMLLESSRLEHGKLALDQAPIDLRRCIRQVASELELISERHTIALELPEHPLMVEGDALRIEQVLYNLVQNAIKYSPAGGSIAVSARTNGAQTIITVRDTGLGIPADDLPFVFDRFYRAGNIDGTTISGLGLGLFLAKELIELHGGTVTVVSEVGQGTTFTIVLPRMP